MLSIGKLANGQQQYYERQVAEGKDDYYSGRGEAPGEWVGRGAAHLGLSGRVEAARFNALAAGVDPSDPALTRTLRDDGRSSQVAAYDLTFSAPKSVSVLFAAADERTAGELVGAHEAAVSAALDYVQDEAVRVRRGHGGQSVEPGGGLVAAAYRHRMSRALDPQLHTHVVAANVTRGPDGRWTGLWGTPLYREAKTAGYLYQAHLRFEVTRRLGLEWGPVTKGSAELAALPEEALGEFSRRRHEILARERELAAAGTSLDRSGRERVAYDTRERKDYGSQHDTPTWRHEVRARAGEHGLTQRAVDELVADGRDQLERGLPADPGLEALAAGVLGDHLAGEHGLTARANTFASREALQELASAARTGAPVTGVRAAGQAFTARGDVMATQTGGWTTTELVASERRLIAAARGRADEGTAVVADGALERGLAGADRPLSGQQAAAVRAIATSGNGVDIVEALAGTGKTYTAGVLRQVYEQAGHPVIGLAPTGRAVRELAEEAGVAAWTIDRALIDHERYGQGLPRGAVVLVDEAGMAATRPTERVLDLAQAAGAKVVAIGDSGQLPSVLAGGWMRAVGDQVGRHELTEVVRQRDTTERRALGLLHDGRPEGYLAWAQDHERVAVHTEEGANATALAEWRAAAAQHGAPHAVLIARDNATREHLNDHARAHQRAQGALTGPDVAYGPVNVAVGDRIICRRNDRDADVDNGTKGTVRAAHADRLILETDAGPVRELPAGYVADHVQPAYALTGHGMQGGTVEHATVVATPRDLTRGWSYTALSRARGTTRLHVDAHAAAQTQAAERVELGPDQHPVAADHSAVMAQLRARMAVRDDEDLAVSQLPARPAPGRADDPRLAEAVPDAGPERGAQAAEATAPAPERQEQLRALQHELAAVRAQRDSLPVRELRALADVDVELERTQGQRNSLAQRLEALPQPRRRLGRLRDEHATERARLTAAVDAANEQLDAVVTHRDRLVGRLGDAQDLRAEHAGLQARSGELDRDATRLRDQLADERTARGPAWARQELGMRPAHPRGAEHWDRGVRAVERYRVEHDVNEATPGLGPEPDGPATQDWQRARGELRSAQRRLGRDVAPDLERDRALER